jgi:cytochrome c553
MRRTAFAMHCSMRALLSSILFLLLPLLAAAQPPPPDPMAQRLRPCTTCHGPEGRATNSGYWPRIAGKPAGYLYNQLVHFREGRRRNAAMERLLEPLSDDYLREIAAWFGALDLPYSAPQPRAAAPAVLARGVTLVRDGDAARGIPACTTCHGERMTGVLPSMPGLVGLPRGYLVGQLGAWRSGHRRASAPDCMGEVARRLGEADIEAVTVWLSAQPTVADMRPAPTHRSALPLDCGSGQR